MSLQHEMAAYASKKLAEELTNLGCPFVLLVGTGDEGVIRSSHQMHLPDNRAFMGQLFLDYFTGFERGEIKPNHKTKRS